MPLTNAGTTLISQLLVGEAVAPLNNANAYTGVGDSTTAFAKAQTDLQAATNKTRKGMDASYPQRSGSILSLRSTYGASDANFTWNEWAVFNAASGGTMVTRKVESLGTKASPQVWQFIPTLTVQNP